MFFLEKNLCRTNTKKAFHIWAVTNHKSQICDCDTQTQMRYGNAPLFSFFGDGERKHGRQERRATSVRESGEVTETNNEDASSSSSTSFTHTRVAYHHNSSMHINPTCKKLHGCMCVIPQDTGESVMCKKMHGFSRDLEVGARLEKCQF